MREGRGAWPTDGRGGTLAFNRTSPGKFYLYSPGFNMVGLEAVLKFLDNQPVPRDELAVNYGVRGIQDLLKICPQVNSDELDQSNRGVFDEATRDAVVELQKVASLTPDGVVGPQTMKSLMLLPILRTASATYLPYEPVWGLLAYEGAWDPGAVGYLDGNDLGMAQVNTVAHPHVTWEMAFSPAWAILFICNYLNNASKYLDGNLRDMVASYNLGIGGAKQWIRAGRPGVWQPSWSSLERYPNDYIDRILNAHKE